MTPRTVVIHYHIFKNAGSSVDRFLRDRFAERWASFEGSNATDIVSEPRLRAFLDANPSVAAVSSHLSRPPLPVGYRVLPIIFIRHPLDRLESVYEFCRIDANQPGHELIATLSLQEYVEWALRDREGVVVRNYQTIHLSDASFRAAHIYDAVAKPQDLDQAMAFLRALPVIGVVDRFNASMARIQEIMEREHAFAAPAGDEPRRYLENTTRGTSLTLEERLARLHSRLGESLWRRALDANALDMGLYQRAAARLERAS